MTISDALTTLGVSENTLSGDEKAALDRDGYLVLHGMLTRDQWLDIFEIRLLADPHVEFDRSHLNQVMWNLCRNALRHCRREKASIRVIADVEVHDGIVKLDVVDDGPGVPIALRSQLFEPFFTTATGGTGLGLYIAREVCEANNARLDYVETAAGARFTIQCRMG